MQPKSRIVTRLGSGAVLAMMVAGWAWSAVDARPGPSDAPEQPSSATPDESPAPIQTDNTVKTDSTVETDSTSPAADARPVGSAVQQVAGDQGPADIRDEAALRDILDIRRQQGTLLRGTVLEQIVDPTGSADQSGEWSEREFLNALRAVISTSSIARTSASQPAIDASPDTRQCEDAYRDQLRREHLGLPSEEPKIGPPAADLALTLALRHAGEQLDRKANDLENVGRYAEADHLRELATELRLEARRWTDAPLGR